MRKPDFFIVGAPKCGTTAMYYYLRLHPEIFLPKVKEPTYFSSDFAFAKNWYGNKEKNYLALFSEATKEKRVGEASTNYLYSRVAAKNIKKFAPNANIIIMLRNPVNVIHSLHSEQVYNTVEDIQDFREALNAEGGRKKGKIPVRTVYKKLLYYREAADFYPQVKRYIDLFGKDKVRIILFKDFIDHPQKVYAEVLRFLKVNPNFKIDFKKLKHNRVINPNKKPRILFIQKFVVKPPRVVAKIVRLLPWRLRYFLAEVYSKLNTNYQPRPDLPEDLRKSLANELKPGIVKLGKLINRDLSFWYKE